MTEHRADRPSRLVSVCVYLGALGAFQVVEVITVLSRWYSSDGQKQVKRFTDPLVEAGLSRGGAETTFRIYLGVLAVLAASALVFAVYSAMGHAVSRIMLTITAPLAALAGMGEGSVLAIALTVVTIYCVTQLWTPDVRRWFALVAGTQPPAPVAQVEVSTLSAERAAPPAPSDSEEPPAQSYSLPPAGRPTDWVKIWSIVTLVGATLVAIGCGMFLVVYGFARDQFVDMEVNSSGNWAHLTEAEVRDSAHDLAVLSWVALPLCVVAIGVSITLLLRRRQRR